MKITDIRATTVAVPLEAPLRHANGAHWGKFVRTIVEVEIDEGLVGPGDVGGGGEAEFRIIRSATVCGATATGRQNFFGRQNFLCGGFSPGDSDGGCVDRYIGFIVSYEERYDETDDSY